MNRDNELLAVVHAHIEAERQAFTITKLLCAVITTGLITLLIILALSVSPAVAM